MANQLISASCRCGLRKLPVSAGSSIGMCTNCDMVQATEYNDGDREGYRVPTQSDRRYYLAWEQLKRQIYPRKA